MESNLIAEQAFSSRPALVAVVAHLVNAVSLKGAFASRGSSVRDAGDRILGFSPASSRLGGRA